MEGARNSGGALHGGLFLVILGVMALGWPTLAWPWYLLLPLLAYSAIVLALPVLRRTAPRISVGRLGGGPLAYTVLLTISTAAVLVGFQALVRAELTSLASRLPEAAFGNLLLAGVCFSVLNALLEEIIFRAVLWSAVAGEWNDAVALLVTSALFGLGHLHGYPPGPLGAILAGLYGVALGLLRWWTGGLGLAVGCHVCADATIFGILLWSGALDR